MRTVCEYIRTSKKAEERIGRELVQHNEYLITVLNLNAYYILFHYGYSYKAIRRK